MDQPKTDRVTWFRDMGATTTIMVPTTKVSSLARVTREVPKLNPDPPGTSVKVVKTPGTP